jgi:methyl-accepting chemotaxis protein
LSAIGKLENAYKDTAEKTFRKAVLAEAMNTAESEMLVGQRGLLLYSALKNPAMAEEARSLFHASSDRIAGYIKEFRPLIDTQEGHELMGRIETGLNSWNGVFSEMEGLVRSGHADQAAAVGAQRALPIHEDLATMAVRLTEIQSQTLAGNRSNAAELSTISRWITSVLILLCLLSGVGALTVVQRMNKTFQSLASELGEGAAQLASAAAQVSASSQTLAQGASEQAASLEETSASSEEISSMTMKNSENSSLAAQNMVEAARRIDGANRSLDMMITSMNEINASSDKISRIIKGYRRDCVPDQHSGAERGSGSGSGG